MDVYLVKHSASDVDIPMAARVSTQGTHSTRSHVLESGDKHLIRYLMRERHGSPFEHSVMTFFISAPIFVFRELMRHRIASYNEESGRYRQLQPVFYIPDVERPLVQQGKPGAYEFVHGSDDQVVSMTEHLMCRYEDAYQSYETLLKEGIAREVARAVLPVGIYSSMYMTINARSLMNVLSLRTKHPDSRFPSYPQHEITLVADQMEKIWESLMPVTHAAFNDNGRVAP
jgi:thymidylate synthase (FAD)